MQVLDQKFFNRDTLIVAKELLGCKLHRRIDNEVLSGIIVETEAYKQDDPACHAYKGKTKRAITLFKDPGLSYVYMIYGMYHCVNFVTEPYDTAGAVLIRALEPILPLKNTNGPGKLCREMQISKKHNEILVTDINSPLWVTKGDFIEPDNIIETTRIGIKQAVDYPWRFYVKNSLHVSKK